MPLHLPASAPFRQRAARLVRAAVVAFIVCLVVLGSGSRTAFAHRDLESTEPSSGAVVAETPERLIFRFTGAVDPVPGGIRVVDGNGIEIDIGAPGRIDGSTSTLAVNLPPLANGTFVVAWRAVSADSHPIAGAFTFSVGTSSETLPGLVDDLLAQDQQLGGASEMLAGGRWASYTGIALVAGVVACGVLLGSPLTPQRRRVLIVAGSAAAVTGTVVMIAAQAAITVNRWSGISEIDAWSAALESSAGRWWLIRIGAVIVIALAGILGAKRLTASRATSAAFAVGCVAMFAIVAAGGHSISGRAVPLGFAATVGHLAAMSVWIGGLVTIALTKRGGRIAVARRFSPYAFAAVVTLAGTGLINAWRQIGMVNGLTDTSYGRWLLAKMAILAVVISIAGVTRWVLTQPAADDSAAPDRASNATSLPVGRLVLAETLGIAVVLIATAFLVNSPPARAVTIGPASVSVVNGERIAQVTVDPARTGGTTMHVYITGPSVLDEPDEIVVQISQPGQGIGPLVIDTSRAGPSHVTTPQAVFPFAGTWTIEVRARYGDFDLVTFTGQLVIR